MFSHITKDFFGNKISIAIGFGFISLGLLFGSWATFIPNLKSDFQLNDAQLGLLLLNIPFGALSMNPVAAYLIRKIGAKKTTIIGIASACVSFGLLLNMPNIYSTIPVMFWVGSSISIANVALNTCVNVIEHDYKVRIMSTCHGMFSFGLMGGSLMSSFFADLQAKPGFYMAGLTTILSFILLVVHKNILTINDPVVAEDNQKSKFKLPTGSFLLMIIIGLCINITEGTMADWSAVYMREVVKTSTFFEGWGMAGYSLFMALGRFTGDKIIPKFGANNVLFTGGLLAITGIAISIFFPYTASSIAGFALVGAGVSCGAPILYASAARVPGMANGSGLAVMNTFAMGGFLFGPVIIGFISKAFSLPIAFAFIAVLGLMWVFQSKRVKLF